MLVVYNNTDSVTSLNNYYPSFQKNKVKIMQFLQQMEINKVNITAENVFEIILTKVRGKFVEIQGKNKQLLHRMNQQEIKVENYEEAIKELEVIQKSFKQECKRLEDEMERKNEEIKRLKQHIELKEIQINWLRPKLEDYSKQIKKLTLNQKQLQQNQRNSRSSSLSKQKPQLPPTNPLFSSRSHITSTQLQILNQQSISFKQKYTKSKQAYYRLLKQSSKTQKQLNEYNSILEHKLDQYMKQTSQFIIQHETDLRTLTKLQKQNRRLEKEITVLDKMMKQELRKSRRNKQQQEEEREKQ